MRLPAYLSTLGKYTHAHTRTRTHDTCTHASTHTCTHAHMHTRTHSHTHTHTYALTHLSTQGEYKHTHTYTNTHLSILRKYTHIHAYTHTHANSLSLIHTPEHPRRVWRIAPREWGSSDPRSTTFHRDLHLPPLWLFPHPPMLDT